MTTRTMDGWSLALAAVLHAVIILVTAWDLWVQWRGDSTHTVSSIIRGWAVQWPLLPFATGVIVGHLFWCASAMPPGD
jgi:H+/Cl- antiporter ClcA